MASTAEPQSSRCCQESDYTHILLAMILYKCTNDSRTNISQKPSIRISLQIRDRKLIILFMTEMSEHHLSQASDATAASSELFTFRLYHYTPSLPAAAVSVVIFAILTGIHALRMHKAGSVYFTPFTVGGLFQVLGYAGRIWSHYNPLAIGGFVIQAILILVAPALYAASIYMILGRLIRTMNAQHLSIIPVNRLTQIFVTGDVVSFTLQAGGGGIQAAGTLDLYNAGEKIIIVGLFVQIALFSIFMAVSVTCYFRLRSFSPVAAAMEIKVPWKQHLYALLGTSILILVRSIFRVIEYLQGNGGYLISHEVFLYVFDTLLMVVVMTIFAVWYIDDLQAKNSMYGNNLGSYSSNTNDDDQRGIMLADQRQA
ncbi:hypothetical protein AAE478_009945 [Parahypoxylon ruwenzoriense]